MAQRFDRGVLRKPTKLENGFIRADAFVTRIGVFEYLNSDGSKHHELRHPKEVFAKDSLATLCMLPVTHEHPTELLTADNAKDFTVGSTGERPEQDGRFIRTVVQINSAPAIRDVLTGTRRELSCGYLCDKDNSPGITIGIPGIPDGIKYDAIQKNIRYNHVAITEKGRAGPEVSLPRFDSLDVDTSIMVIDSDYFETDGRTPEGAKPMETEIVTIDGVQYDISKPAAQAYRKSVAINDGKSKEMTDRLDEQTAIADGLKEQIADMKKKLDEMEEKMKEEMSRDSISKIVKLHDALPIS